MKTTTAITWTPQLTTLYADHFEELVHRAERIVHDRTLAEDAVQDSFLRFATGQCAPAPGSELAYLRTMVRNQALTTLRRDACATRATDALAAYTATTAPAAEAEALLAVEAEELVAEMACLSDRQQQVLGLRCLSGYSVNETASHLAISVGSVKTHTHRGSGSMQQRLAAAA